MGLLLRKAIHLLFALFLLGATFLFDKPRLLWLLFFIFSLESLWEYLRLQKPHYLPKWVRWEGLLKEFEKRTLSDAWYFIVGLLIAGLLLSVASLRPLLVILGFSDTLAWLVGRSLKGPKIYREKTLPGTVAFFLSSLFILYLLPPPCFHTLSLVVVSTVTTFCELLTKRDNLFVSLGYALSYTLDEKVCLLQTFW